MPSSGFKTCALDRKSTRLNSSHTIISYAVFCLKKTVNATAPHLLGAALFPRLRAAQGAVGNRASLSRLHPVASNNGYAASIFFLMERPPPKATPFPLHAPLPT